MKGSAKRSTKLRPNPAPIRRGCVLVLSTCLLACAHPATKPAAQPSKDRGSALILVPEANPAVDKRRPWGAPVPDSATEARVRTLLSQVVAGEPWTRVSVFGRPLIIGPALWSFLLKATPTVRDLGTPGTAIIPHPDGTSEDLTMRTFLDDGAVAQIAGQAAFLRLLEGFVAGSTRAANEEERKLFYTMVPFEIFGKPLTILQTEDARLVVDLDGLENGRVMWLDLISGYRAPATGKPPGPRLLPEQRAFLREQAGKAEANPAGTKGADAERALALVVETSDFSMKLCADALVPVVQAGEPLNASIVAMLGAGAWAMDHPPAADDITQHTLAAVRSVLRAYEHSLKRDAARIPLLSDLLARERERTLADYVTEKSRACKTQ